MQADFTLKMLIKLLVYVGDLWECVCLQILQLVQLNNLSKSILKVN